MSDSKKEEKKAVPPWMTNLAKVGGSGGGSGFGGGAGGAGLLGKLSALLAAPKVVVALTVAGGLALGGGIAFRQTDSVKGLRPGAKTHVNFDRQAVATEKPAGALPGAGPEGPSALVMAQQANRGALDAAAAAAAAEGAGAEGGEETASADAPAADPAAGEAQTDPAASADAMAAAMTAQGVSAKAGVGEGGLGRKFGSLSSSIGGSGGSSASLSSAGPGRSLSGAQGGQLRGMSQNAKADVMPGGKSAARSAGKKSAMGATADRLKGMSGAMGNAAGKNPEVGAATANQQWDNSPTGSSLAGPSSGGIGNDGFTDSATTSNGSPTSSDSGTKSCPSGWSGTPPDCTAPDTDSGGNSGMNLTPYQGMVDMAVLLLGIATFIMLMIGFFGKAGPLAAAAPMLIKIVIGIGAVVALMGAGIMMMGQSGQGALFAGLGTMTSIFAYLALGDSGAGWQATTSAKAMAFSSAAMAALGGGLGGFSTGDHKAFDKDDDD